MGISLQLSAVSYQLSASSFQFSVRVWPTPTGSHITGQGRDALVAQVIGRVGLST